MYEQQHFIEIHKQLDGTVEYVAYEVYENILGSQSIRELFRDENRALVEDKLLDYIKNHEEPIG